MKQREELEQLGRDILENARRELYLSMRFLDAALYSFTFRMNLKTRTVGTDGVSILYHPAFLRNLYLEDAVLVNRLYLHCLLHAVFQHEDRAAGKEERLWNLAADIAAEYIVDGLSVRAVKQLVPEEKEAWYATFREKLPAVTAEQLCRYFKKEPPSFQEQERLEALFVRDDHAFWQAEKQREKNKERDGKDKREGKEESGQKQSQGEKEARKQKWNEIARRIMTGLESGLLYSDEYGELYKFLRIQARSRVDYRSFLRRFASHSEENKLNEEEFELGFYLYGLSLYRNLPLIEPLEYKEEETLQDFVIVLDTSGSCEKEWIRIFLQETYAMLSEQAYFSRRTRLRLLQCDVRVTDDTLISSKEELRAYMDRVTVKGMGGTDFGAAFSYVDELLAKGEVSGLKGLFYFTDGKGSYPKKKPAYETVFAVIRSEEEAAGEAEIYVPAWATKLLFTPEELRELEECSTGKDEWGI